MPRVSYNQKYKAAGEIDKFPRFKLGIGEKSRIWLPDEPWMEYYHRIEAPVIDHGEVQMEVIDTKRGPKEVPKMDWIGSSFCVGLTGTPDNPGPLMLQGIDPGNCPACESAANDTGVRPPEQRFAAPVVKYKIKQRGRNPYELISPISAEILVWAYTGRQHGLLFDLAAREDTDLRKLDVTVDMEDTPGADKYQKIKAIAAIREPAWKDPKVKAYIRELWANEENRPTEEQLREACLGRDYARPVLLDMVRRAEQQYRDSMRAGGSGGDLGAADAGFNGSLDEGIGALLDDGPSGNGEVPPADDPFAGPQGSTQTVPAATTTGTAAPDAEPVSRTEPKSATSAAGSDGPLPDDERAAAVESAADGLFGEPSGDSASPEPEVPTQARGRSSQGRTAGSGNGQAAAEEPAPEPEPAAVSSGGVVDFDDLFKD